MVQSIQLKGIAVGHGQLPLQLTKSSSSVQTQTLTHILILIQRSSTSLERWSFRFRRCPRPPISRNGFCRKHQPRRVGFPRKMPRGNRSISQEPRRCRSIPGKWLGWHTLPKPRSQQRNPGCHHPWSANRPRIVWWSFPPGKLADPGKSTDPQRYTRSRWELCVQWTVIQRRMYYSQKRSRILKIWSKVYL